MHQETFHARSTVYSYYRKWQGRGIWEELNHTLRDQVREKLGRSTQPSARLLRSRFANAADSQKGLNGGKKGGSALGRQCVGRVSRLEASAVGRADLKQLAWDVYGNDCGKKVKGRKRQTLVDSQGLLLKVIGKCCKRPRKSTCRLRFDGIVRRVSRITIAIRNHP
jgi:transposase